jgi:DNA polymerase II small subunit/DNA polymerase delta subunit B
MKFKWIAVLALVAMVAAPAFGADDEKKKERKGKKGAAARSASAQLLKQLEPVGLTDEQVAKIKEIGAKSQAELKAARAEAGITPELQKKLAAAQKSMKDSELKGKERMAAIHKAAGLTEAQATALKKSNELRMEMHKQVIAMLTAEQKEKLPQNLKRLAGAKKGGAKKGEAKKKKKDAA